LVPGDWVLAPLKSAATPPIKKEDMNSPTSARKKMLLLASSLSRTSLVLGIF
jgi:hypothetical protein